MRTRHPNGNPGRGSLAGGSLDQGKKRIAAPRPHWNGHREEKDVDFVTVEL